MAGGGSNGKDKVKEGKISRRSIARRANPASSTFNMRDLVREVLEKMVFTRRRIEILSSYAKTESQKMRVNAVREELAEMEKKFKKMDEDLKKN